MQFIKSTKGALLSTLLISILCFIIFQKSGVLDNVGMAAIILNWLPLIIGIFTIIAYFVINLITKKHSWIVAIIGNVLNIMILIMALIDK